MLQSNGALGVLVFSILASCAPALPTFLESPGRDPDDAAIRELEHWSQGGHTAEERAGRLFLLADAAYKYARLLQEKGENSPEVYLNKAEGALLRILELKAGPQDQARHNLAILFQTQNDSAPQEGQESPGKEGSPKNEDAQDSPSQEKTEQNREPRDLSGHVRQKSESEVQKEAVLEMEAQRRQSREQTAPGVPIPLQEDW